MKATSVIARRRLEQKLKETQQILQLAIQGSAAGIGVADPDHRWIFVNPALSHLTGYSEDELLALTVNDLVDPEDLDRHDAMLEALVRGERTQIDAEERFATRDGASFWVRILVGLVQDEGGNPRWLVIQVTDLRQVKERELDLERQAHLDPLTGVGNRRLLHHRLACALADRRQGDSQIALALVDLDDFKGINDRYGHAAGDTVLTTVARRLSEAVRAHDTVARVGGDEFVVLCPNLPEGRETDVLFARLAEQFNEPFLLDEGSVTVAASIGLVLAAANERAESLLARADAEMYCAKFRKTTPVTGLGRRAVRAV